jgi:hypothetical protein
MKIELSLALLGNRFPGATLSAKETGPLRLCVSALNHNDPEPELK